MKTSHFIKVFLSILLLVWVGHGNASLNGKCSKAAGHTKSAPKPKASSALHFAPLDVLRW
jgi:hypothetical protein